MKRIFYLLLIVSTTLTISCQKELNDNLNVISPPGGTDGGGDSSNSIVGTWNFVSITAETESSTAFNVSGINQKSIAFLNYITENNKGVFIIDDSVIHSKDLAYTISSLIETYTYKNGVLIDSLNTPFNTIFPPTESYSPYKMVGTDSIYFSKNGLTNISASKIKINPPAAKIDLAGNTLKFIQTVYKDSIQNVSGVDYHIIQSGNAVITLQRQ